MLTKVADDLTGSIDAESAGALAVNRVGRGVIDGAEYVSHGGNGCTERYAGKQQRGEKHRDRSLLHNDSSLSIGRKLGTPDAPSPSASLPPPLAEGHDRIASPAAEGTRYGEPDPPHGHLGGGWLAGRLDE